ncbi:hypothetical protein BX600DRAFT_190209 [Xylariales sp. PMI_506]|nr:hypothetical protein BX600DRAFT_190209 [Xylariales sp. PMI_506]
MATGLGIMGMWVFSFLGPGVGRVGTAKNALRFPLTAGSSHYMHMGTNQHQPMRVSTCGSLPSGLCPGCSGRKKITHVVSANRAALHIGGGPYTNEVDQMGAGRRPHISVCSLSHRPILSVPIVGSC